MTTVTALSSVSRCVLDVAQAQMSLFYVTFALHILHNPSLQRRHLNQEDKESLKSSKKVQFDVSVKPLHHEVFRYAKGDKLTYTRTGETVTVVNIHFDDNPPYYTIAMPDGREKQTTYENLKKLG